jgi:7-cyano-7-deazaguanine synthase
MKEAVAIVSGGMDSTTLAYLLRSEGYKLHLLSFDYGQRHKKELYFVKQTASTLNASWSIIDLSSLKNHLSGSALTDDIDVPEGHYADDNMKITVVPNRNAIMLSVAYGVAVSRQSDIVATGVHSGDHFIYPDCRPRFINAFDIMQSFAVDKDNLKLYAPFVNMGKHDIASIGASLNVPFEQTWSCYNNGKLHCGKCGTCVERKESFKLAGLQDPTEYEV